METCKCDHDRLTIRFDPALAKELSDAWADGGPENINLRDASREKLLHVAAYCLTAAADYQDATGKGRFCWRLHHCGVDICNQIVRKFFRGTDDLADVDVADISITGTAKAGGWRS